MNIGIDFGTTNSAVSRVDQDGKLETLVFGGAQEGKKYVPSLVAHQFKPRPATRIGVAARGLLGLPRDKAAVYANFKMLLGETDPSVISRWGYSESCLPDHIAGQFMEGLHAQIKKEHQIEPRRVVVTVPEIWIRQNLHIRREKLIKSITSTGIHEIKLESEPLAAATYYLHKYAEKNHEYFNGHLLICDCGGGTMDFCLAEVESLPDALPVVTVVARAGNGQINGMLGQAGVAYDEALVDTLLPGLRDQDQKVFFDAVMEFERLKIERGLVVIDEEMPSYFEQPESVADDELFQLRGESITPRLLVECFDKVVRDGILRALEELRQQTSDISPDLFNDPRRFRVVLVGGFSQFYLVRRLIMDHFASVSSSDKRFESVLLLEDVALAISKGAALIANHNVLIRKINQVDLGVVATSYQNGRTAENNYPILHKGQEISAYFTPTYHDEIFYILNSEHPLRLFCDPKIPGATNPFTFEVEATTMRHLVPDSFWSDQSGMVKIGFSMDQNLVYNIHVQHWSTRDKKPVAEKVTSLGNILANMPGLVTSP
jgi:molecular chaperone DnaK